MTNEELMQEEFELEWHMTNSTLGPEWKGAIWRVWSQSWCKSHQIFEQHEHQLLHEILSEVKSNKEEVRKLMSQIDDLNTAVQAVSDDVDKVSTDVQAVLGLLKQTPPDVSGAITKLQGVDTSLKAVDAGLTAVLPATPPTA